MLIPTLVAIIAVALRFWIRWRKLHSEDWVTLGTMIFSTAYTTSGIVQTRFGLGLPWAMRPAEYTREYLVANYAAWPFYLFALAGFKLALCISYLRMTRGSLDTKYRHFIIGVASFSSAAHLVFVLMFMFACQPLSRIFDFSIEGYCLPFSAVNYALGATVVVLDVTIFLLPIPLIRRLRLDRATKTGLIIVFALGLITTVLSILRLQQIPRIVNGDGDTTKFTVRGSMELNVGIITSCLPFLRPVFRHLPPKFLACFSTNASSKASQGPGFNPILTIGGGGGGSVSHQHSSPSAPQIGNHSAISSKSTSKRDSTSLLTSFQSRPRSPEAVHQQAHSEMSVMKTVHVEVDSVQAPLSPTLWLAADRGGGEEFGRGKTRREVWEFSPTLG
ncbi:uncharacterized protein RCC_05996 [Ramularia collo-cygni]|uniref:Rhodopsin domain-containing protein n=1 Tax=Ramularia collo-cygni TaxID=112498 RepID=A0A2D3VEH3_9PEZI|nr:uncharacterized protein RCC_05996 [Ramularia collo-cygni]CZT20139.1 uncharacterized protein RCC_05996 [Ramularia collo-cygni]